MELELIKEIFAEVGIQADDENMLYIFEQFQIDAENSADLYSNTHSYHPSCSKCERLEYELKEVTRERDAYHKSVCERRNTKNVYIDQYGSVKYVPD